MTLFNHSICKVPSVILHLPSENFILQIVFLRRMRMERDEGQTFPLQRGIQLLQFAGLYLLPLLQTLG